ncbi:MAG: ArsR/SmtB family transcription factor [Flavobacteriaceae bacterium]
MEKRRDVFQAIADPTRREIINLLAQQPRNLNAIAQNFEVSRQAISLHIKILRECNLISIRQEGRDRICEARLEQLNEVHDWTAQFKAFWTLKLRSLKEVLENPDPDKNNQDNTNKNKEL